MASQAAVDAGAEDGVEIEVKPRGGLNGKKLILFIVLPLLLLVGAGGATYFLGLLDPLLGIEATAEGDAAAAGEGEHAEAGPSVYYELPEMLINLNSTGKKSNFLKITVSLELESAEAVTEVEAVLPRVIDSFQVYLRELRIDDLRGSAGLYRLREELLLRVNAAVEPVKVRDVLFKEMLVQ
jgi:flagellar FliL protein